MVAPILIGLIVIALLMVVSGHDVAIVAAIVVFAGTLAAIAARLLAGGILRDIHAIRAVFSYYNVDPANVRNIADIGGDGCHRDALAARARLHLLEIKHR